MTPSDHFQLTNKSSVLACLVATMVGCGGDTARVEGVVLLNGKEVVQTDTVRCKVTMKPVSGGPAAIGSVSDDGHFRLSVGSSNAVPPGEYLAAVRVVEVAPSDQPGGYASSRAISPKRYASTTTSGLKYNLTPGRNQLEIELE